MLQLSCLCGDVRIETPRPDYVHECNCLFCSKSGGLWGYFDPAVVRVEGSASGYCREDKDDAGAEVRFCARCGSTTHWTLTASAVAKFGNTLMGVNMRLADERDLAGIEVRYPDGRAWSGAGDFTFVREARIIGGSPA